MINAYKYSRIEIVVGLILILWKYIVVTNKQSVLCQLTDKQIPTLVAARQKLLVVYNYHWPFDGSLNFIQNHFIPWFRWNFKRDIDVVFYGPEDKGVIRTNNMPEGGGRSYMTLISAYKDNPTGYYGYLQLNDDSFLNPYILGYHDFTRPLCEGAGGIKPGHAPPWISILNEHGDNRWDSANKWIKNVCNKTNNGLEMCKHPVDRIPAGYADFFYIPKTHMPMFEFLFNECLREDVFLEFCVPASIANFDYSVIPRCCGLDEITSRTCGHLHPIKLSKKSHRRTLKSWLRRYETEVDYFMSLKPNIIKQLKAGWNCDGFGVL